MYGMHVLKASVFVEVLLIAVCEATSAIGSETLWRFEADVQRLVCCKMIKNWNERFRIYIVFSITANLRTNGSQTCSLHIDQMPLGPKARRRDL
jgi:hypothetical protein